MELGRSAWIRRERLARIATAERDRRAGRTALAVAALGEASEWPARAVLALALLPESEGSQARRILEEGLDVWAMEAGMPPLDAPDGSEGSDALDSPDRLDALNEHNEHEHGHEGAAEQAFDSPAGSAFEAFQIELDRPIEAGELEQAFAEAEAQVDEMHDVNRVAERVLFDGAFELTDLAGEELDPLEQSARLAAADRARVPMDAASLPGTDSARGLTSARPLASERWDVDAKGGRPSREIVLATLERWLQNLAQSGAEGMR
jgi:hypothetical protein